MRFESTTIPSRPNTISLVTDELRSSQNRVRVSSPATSTATSKYSQPHESRESLIGASSRLTDIPFEFRHPFLKFTAWCSENFKVPSLTITRRAMSTIRLSAILLSCPAILTGGCKATPPGKIESGTAHWAKRWVFVPNSRRANPLASTPANLEFGRASYARYCDSCHGLDGSGMGVAFATHMSPPAPSLASTRVQSYSDSQLKWIIENGLWPSGMPESKGLLTDQQMWSIVLYLRHLTPSGGRASAEAESAAPSGSATYLGSKACEKCHEDIYQRWQKTPMANVVRDPREHPEAIIPDLSKPDPLVKFTRDDVALVYGSLWKQRYFTKVGKDYFPEAAQWDVTHQVWRPYFVAPGTDWWEPFYPADNMKRPTGPTCDGCHSVNYNIHDKTVTEWNVGCERCHGPGSEHVAHPSESNIWNPGRMDYVRGNDTCIACHSQGRPLETPWREVTTIGRSATIQGKT